MPFLNFLVSYDAEEPFQTATQRDVITELERYYSGKERYSPTTGSNHQQSNTHWLPKLNLSQVLPAPTPGQSSSQINTPVHFTNYFDTPSTFGEEPLPALVYHTACEVDDVIYILGGCVVLHNNYNYNCEIDHLSKFVVDLGVQLPLPMDPDFINFPTVIPNDHLYMVSTVTNRVSKPELRGEVPPPLLAMSASQITKRHILYYGGFQVVNKVTVKEGIYHIEKQMILNNHAYVLDVYTKKFRKLALEAHPNTVTRYPITVPRFGHSSTAIYTKTRPADVYIMGGFRQKSDKSFEAIQDIWRLELSISYEGANDYTVFGEMVLATPVASIGAVPKARSFHAMSIYQGKIVFHGGTDGREIFGDLWMFDPSNETWQEIETFYHGKRAQVKKVGHQGVVLDRFFAPLVGAIPEYFEDYTDPNDSIPDVSSCYRLKQANSDPGLYWMWLLNFNTREWILEKVYHEYYIPVAGEGEEMSHTGNVGCTVSTGNSRTLLIGGMVTASPSHAIGKMHALHSGMGCYEFPLGCRIESADVE